MNAVIFRTQVTQDHRVRLPEALPVGCLVEITVKAVEPDNQAAATPRSDLGRKLQAIRERAIAKGMRLQTVDEILQEVHEGRGEAGDD